MPKYTVVTQDGETEYATQAEADAAAQAWVASKDAAALTKRALSEYRTADNSLCAKVREGEAAGSK